MFEAGAHDDVITIDNDVITTDNDVITIDNYIITIDNDVITIDNDVIMCSCWRCGRGNSGQLVNLTDGNEIKIWEGSLK